MAALDRFEIKCASRGFRIYRDTWKPKLSQLLEVFHEQEWITVVLLSPSYRRSMLNTV